MKPLVYDELTCNSYLEYRLHKKQSLFFYVTCSYSICTRIFDNVASAIPATYKPLRMLDIGCGCGSASLFAPFSYLPSRAALEHFPSINQVSLVDSNDNMLEISSSLLPIRTSATISRYSSLPSLLEKV